MPKQVIIPPGTTAPIAPFVPGTLADGVVYVSGPCRLISKTMWCTSATQRRKPASAGDHQERYRNGGREYGGCDFQQHLYHRLDKLRRD